MRKMLPKTTGRRSSGLVQFRTEREGAGLRGHLCTGAYGVGRSWPPVQKMGGRGLARLGKDEYHKVVLIEASFPRGPSAPADPRRRLTDPINVKSILRKDSKVFISNSSLFQESGFVPQ
jgi:hypothetical protein